MGAKPMVKRICQACGSAYLSSKYDADRGRTKYCSRRCVAAVNFEPHSMTSRGEVPIEPFREAFIKLYNDDEITFSELAIRMGQAKKETSYVQIMLGLRPARHRDRKNKITYHRFRRKLDYNTAVKLAKALNIDPMDAGI